MDLKGKVHEVQPTQQVTESLKKRNVIIEYADNPQYPEYIQFEAVQDRCKLLDDVKVGDDIEIYFNIKGRPWTDKTGKKSYFNSLQLWKITVLGSQPVKTYTPPSAQTAPDDDLPF